MLEHGGRLLNAARDSGIPLADWLDLSTGINPVGWPGPAPFPAVPAHVWQRLPEVDDGLELAAARYYDNDRLLPLPGSQAAIQNLPRLFPRAAVACLSPIYAEHAAGWKAAGHTLLPSPAGDLQHALSSGARYVLLCNPNNPTAHAIPRASILAAAEELARREAWLFVDEAFVDAVPEYSVSDMAGSRKYPFLVVFRSPGKFFGLAGARIGFLLGPDRLLAALREQLGPWAVNHPARWISTRALCDRNWQALTRSRLKNESERLKNLLAPCAAEGGIGVSPLFVTLALQDPRILFDFLRGKGILTRCFPEAGLLRFGLPGDAAQWSRLIAALGAATDK
jgi:cobalamin biosynthetic protein CobC